MTMHWRTAHTGWFRCLAPAALYSLCTLVSTGTLADVNAGMSAIDRKNYTTAVREFRTAAEQGNAKAQTLVAMSYYEGKGVAQDKN